METPMGVACRGAQLRKMVQALHLDSRAKCAIGLLVVVVIAVLALGIRSSIVALTPESITGTSIAQSEDELVQIGRVTLLLKHGGVGNRIAHWVNARSSTERAFELYDRSFAQGSDALTSEGEARVSGFAQMMIAAPELRARILVMTDQGNSDLAQRRAKRLQSILVGSGVPSSHISASIKQIEVGARASADPELIFMLSRPSGSVSGAASG